MNFTEQSIALTEDQRLHFYEVLAHNLTVCVRGVWSDDGITDKEKVLRMKELNEVLHRVTAKIWVLRLKECEWTEEDFGALLQEYRKGQPEIAQDLEWAVRVSFESVGPLSDENIDGR